MKKVIFAVIWLVWACTCSAGTIAVDYDDLCGRQASRVLYQKPKYAPNEIIIKFHEGVADAIEKQLGPEESSSRLSLSQGLDKLNTRFGARKIESLFKDFREKHRRLTELAKKSKALLSPAEKHILRRQKRTPKGAKVPALDRIFKFEVELEDDQLLEEAVAAYNNDPDVEYAELNYIVTLDTTPDDPYFPIQWPLHNLGQMYPESYKYNSPPGSPDADIDAPEAWDVQTGNNNIIVAVADTGVDYNHRDLDDNMWTNPGGYHGFDYVNHDNYPMDDHGHGTHCAGIIAAEGNNGLDIAGLCWNVKIMAVKSIDEDGYGTYDDAEDAFYYAVNNGADVISNSWGKDEYSQSMQDAIDYAYSQGVIIVASAGNDNTSSAHYPADSNHVISVAATDSNDQKASFSNYGDWVDIAAPGVDVLSLRAAGTSAGKPYDSYTTIMSGTSMSCPHVSGACALLLSKNPSITVDEVNDVLCVDTDPISPGICRSNGRLNIHKAIKTIRFDNKYYLCSDEPNVRLIDFDLEGEPNVSVALETDGGDYETLVLDSAAFPWLFTAAVSTEVGSPVVEDGTLQISHGQTITVTYQDANDGTANPSTETDTAVIDCQGPVVSNVQIEMMSCAAAAVTFETDEPSTAYIRCGLSCGPYTIAGKDVELTMSHRVVLEDLISEQDYYFVIDVNDVAGNQTTDSNAGLCYSFTTGSGPAVIYVPADYPTIQDAIDAAISCTTIIVADGVYTGLGNRDIDFRGKVITLQSENGPENCIIDCQGSALDEHRGFTFLKGEDRTSVLDGFTIINAYRSSKGGAIACIRSSPTIQNCIISNNHAGKRTTYHCGGAGMALWNSDPAIINCIISDNYSFNHGAIFIEGCDDVDIINCVIVGNDADYVSSGGPWSYGGGICCQVANVVIKNCLIADNWSYRFSGGVEVNRGSVVISNCTIANNTAGEEYGGVGKYLADVTIENCIIWGNQAPSYPQLAEDINVFYSDVQDGYLGAGNINQDPCFVDPCDGNYHLQSQAGRWDPNTENWVTDTNTSPCIDAGDPNSDWTSELWPHGKCINMGAYGGTAEASMSNSTAGNIANLDNDVNDVVDYNDLALFVKKWCYEELLLAEDLNRDGVVNSVDYGIFANNWLAGTMP